MKSTAMGSTVRLYLITLTALAAGFTNWDSNVLAEEAFVVTAGGVKIPIVKSTSEFGVTFRRGIDVAACSARLGQQRCGIVEDLPGAEPGDRVKILRTADTSAVRRSRVLQDPDIENVRPVYRFADSDKPVIATGQFLVKVQPALTNEERDQLWLDYDSEVLHAVEGMPNVYLVQPKFSDHDEVLRAQVMAEDPRTIWSQPNFRRPAATRQITPLDIYFAEQWHLNNTGQTGGTSDADIDALEAWTLSEGQDILIGAFDDACDVDHEDLRPNYKGTGHDPTLESNDPGFTDPRPKQIFDQHGTAVLGLAVAQANAVGVRGVSHLSRFTLSRGVTNTVLTDLDRASVFTFARQQRVDVHLNSWGSPVANSAVVEEAIKLAYEEGRPLMIEENGETREVEHGMVIVWASGNEFEENVVGFDYSTVPYVIGVGASNHNDEQSDYSNYGPNIDMLAPGGGLSATVDGLVTTDNTDKEGSVDDGYSSSSAGIQLDEEGKYTNTFTGTSAACPVAAGVAALVLSTNPRLFAADVRLIMEHTCDPVNTEDAQYHGITSRSVRYGYGRINAFQAVQRARETLTNGGITWPGRVFNVRVADGRLRWQTSVGTDEFLIVESGSPFAFAAKDSQCYDRDQLGCASAALTSLPAGVTVKSVIVCKDDLCDLGDDQSLELETRNTTYFGIFARNLIGRYSWGVAADSLGNVLDQGPAISDPADDESGGGDVGGVEGPKVTISVSPLEGLSPLTVKFTGNAVSVFPIDESRTAWDFDVSVLPDVNATTRNATFTYIVEPGASRSFTARLTMYDTQGNLGSASVMIRVTGPDTGTGGTPIGESSLRILVGVPGNPTADLDEGPSPLNVELSVDASSLQGTLQSIVWDLGDGTSPRPTSLVVPHTYLNESDQDLVIPITATVTTITSGSVSLRTGATRLLTVKPGLPSEPSGPPLPSAGDDGDSTDTTCGVLGFFPLVGMFTCLMCMRRRGG